MVSQTHQLGNALHAALTKHYTQLTDMKLNGVISREPAQTLMCYDGPIVSKESHRSMEDIKFSPHSSAQTHETHFATKRGGELACRKA